jgi:hypothetical protein
MRRALGLSVLVIAAAFAGCLGSEDPTAEPAAVDGETDELPWPTEVLGDGHDHTDPEAHRNASTANFETIAHDPLVTEAEGTAPGGSSCADTNPDGDTRIGAQKAGDSRGVVLSDLTDPAEPGYLGELWLTFTLVYDVAVTPDGEHVALITSYPQQGPAPEPALEPGKPLGYFESCTGERVEITAQNQDPVPRPVSLVLVDVSDPSAPTITDQRPIAGLGHSVFSATVDDRDWLVGVTESLAHGGRHYYFHQLTEGPQGTVMEPLSTYVAEPNPDHADYVGGHTDAWIDEHPETGQLLAYLSAGPQVEIVDLSNPRAPQQLSTWTDIGPNDPGAHNLHSLVPYEELVDGKHYTIVGPELGSPVDYAPTAVTWVLDTTDPTDPKPVAAWTLPENVTWEGSLQFSPHYMDKHEDTLFVSMYHGGVWAVDLSKVPEGSPDDVAMLDSLGAYVPAREAPHPDPAYSFSWVPNLEEVQVLEEDAGQPTLVTWDGNTGVYTFTYDDEVEVPTPEPYDLDPAELLPAGGPAPTQAP